MTDDGDNDKAFDEQLGRIIVRRDHYEAGEEIMKTAAPGNAAFAVAEEERDECREKGDRDGAAFWQAVWNYLMSCCVCDPDVKIVILEEGEEWDVETGQVRKNQTPRNNRPPRDKDC